MLDPSALVAPTDMYLAVLVAVLAITILTYLNLQTRARRLIQRVADYRALVMAAFHARQRLIERLPEPATLSGAHSNSFVQASLTNAQLSHEVSRATHELRRLRREPGSEFSTSGLVGSNSVGANSSGANSSGAGASALAAMPDLAALESANAVLAASRRIHNDSASQAVRLRNKRLCRLLGISASLRGIETIEFDVEV